MSGRHQTTTLIGIGIICMTIISIIFMSHHSQDGSVDNAKMHIHHLQNKFVALNKQYESLYGYKERLEKAFLNLKNEKASLVDADKVENLEFSELKELYTKQVQTLQEDLKSCRDQLHSFVVSARNTNSELTQKVADNTGLGPNSLDSLPMPIASSTLNQPPQTLFSSLQKSNNDLSLSRSSKDKASFLLLVDDSNNGLKPSITGSSSNNNNLVKTQYSYSHNSMASNVLKEPIQSPIAQVPMEPAQPSSDPNQDLVGNVLI